MTMAEVWSTAAHLKSLLVFTHFFRWCFILAANWGSRISKYDSSGYGGGATGSEPSDWLWWGH